MRMNIFFFALIFIAVESSTIFSKTLRVVEAQKCFNEQFCGGCSVDERQCQTSMKYINDLAPPWNFSLLTSPIINNPFGIKDIDIYLSSSATDYSFPKTYLKNKTMISTIFLPVSATLKGLVVYYHSTVFGKHNGPSKLGPQVLAIGGLYASWGYGVVFPEYIGFGEDRNSQPYALYPQQTVRSAVNALNQLIVDGVLNRYSNKTFNLYSNGYSEGGAYSVWMSKCLKIPEECQYYTSEWVSTYRMQLDSKYTYIKVAGLEGAYDLKGVMKPFLTQNVGTNLNSNEYQILQEVGTNFGKSSIATLTLISYLEYSLDSLSTMPFYMNREFFEMNCSQNVNKELCKIDEKSYNLITVLKVKEPDSVITNAIGYSALGKSLQAYRQQNILFAGIERKHMGISNQNSIRSLILNNILDSKEFNKTLLDATIVEYGKITQLPTFVFTLAKDSLVSVNNTKNFAVIANETAKNNVTQYVFANKDHIVCNGAWYTSEVDHIRGEVVANVFALTFFNRA